MAPDLPSISKPRGGVVLHVTFHFLAGSRSKRSIQAAPYLMVVDVPLLFFLRLKEGTIDGVRGRVGVLRKRQSSM